MIEYIRDLDSLMSTALERTLKKNKIVASLFQESQEYYESQGTQRKQLLLSQFEFKKSLQYLSPLILGPPSRASTCCHSRRSGRSCTSSWRSSGKGDCSGHW